MNKNTVYIVDDKRLIRESLIKTVAWERYGYIVIGNSGDGITAEEEIRQLRPDVVITDIRMPGRDGLTLASRIQNYLPQVRIIVITGYDKFEYAQSSLRVGAADIILKPIKNEVLEKTLQRIHRKEESFFTSTGDDSSPIDVLDEKKVGHLIKAVILYIEENFNKNLSLSFLADLYRVTPSHLSRIFKKETGISFLRYLMKRRIDEAVKLLDDPALQIGEVAELCGFPNPIRFTNTFKEIMGMTPSEYRRNQSL